jgi:hypothetical protein
MATTTVGTRGTTGTRSPNQLLGTVLGAVYVLIGLVGFAVTSGVGFASTTGDKLLGIFELNPLHNIVHIGVGAALLFAASRGPAFSARLNTAVGAVYFLVGVFGLFVTDKSSNFLALNSADNGLHFASSIVLLAVGLMGARAATARSA